MLGSTVWPYFAFQTDASGNVSNVSFYGTVRDRLLISQHRNFGSWIGDTVFGNAQFYDYNERSNSIAAGGFTNAAEWIIGAVAAVPEPSTWAMLILGFAAWATLLIVGVKASIDDRLI